MAIPQFWSRLVTNYSSPLCKTLPSDRNDIVLTMMLFMTMLLLCSVLWRFDGGNTLFLEDRIWYNTTSSGLCFFIRQVSEGILVSFNYCWVLSAGVDSDSIIYVELEPDVVVSVVGFILSGMGIGGRGYNINLGWNSRVDVDREPWTWTVAEEPTVVIAALLDKTISLDSI